MRCSSALLLLPCLLALVVGAGCDRAELPEDAAATPDAPLVPDGGEGADVAAPGATADAGPEDEGASQSVPTLRIATLDGGTYDLADHRGKWVVVNFWATWCAPCLKEMPELSALDAMHEHIEVVGLAYEDIEPDAMREFLADHPVVYPIAIVDTYDPPTDFDTPRGLPMTYLIAPDGTVAKKVLGPVTAKDIEDAISAGGGPVPVEGGSAPA